MNPMMCCKRWKISKDIPIDDRSINSILSIQGKDPKRLKPLIDLYVLFQKTLIDGASYTLTSFSKITSSIAEVFSIDKIYTYFSHTDGSTLIKEAIPYATCGIDQWMSLHDEASKKELFKSFICLLILGYFCTQNVTQQKKRDGLNELCDKTLVLLSLATLHATCFKISNIATLTFLQSQVQENYITEETQSNLGILFGIIASFALLPALLLKLSTLISSSTEKKQKKAGFLSQISKISPLQIGGNKELNTALQLYQHFNLQLKDPARLFQYFIVALNVLRDGSLEKETPNSSRFVQKTRNMWLLLADSLIKARADLELKASQIEHDTKINHQTFTVFRFGKKCENVCRYELKKGDLIPLKEVLSAQVDPEDGSVKKRFLLSGYILDLKDSSKGRDLVVSLVELNGESKAFMIKPSNVIKKQTELEPIDLFSVSKKGAAVAGTQLIDCDDTNGFFLQIAFQIDEKPHHVKKTPFSMQANMQLKKNFIQASLLAAFIGAFPLMKYRSFSSMKRFIQFYGTQYVDKFSQVFSETQTLIPLVSEIALEMVNRRLLKEINLHQTSPLSEKNALLIADLFEFLQQRKVKIFSDKTGTVTENQMHARAIFLKNSSIKIEDFAASFAATYSNEKTEEEENVLKGFLETHFGIKIVAELGSSLPLSKRKKLTFNGLKKADFLSLRLGLFSQFGGVFTLKKSKDSFELIFCGIPRAADIEAAYFEDTPLLEDFLHQEMHEIKDLESLRQDVLTRDWCLAKASITEEEFESICEAFYCENKKDAQSALIAHFHKLKLRFEYLGVFLIDNPIKKGAQEAIKHYKDAGIDFVLITGDTKKAAYKIAPKLLGQAHATIYESQAFLDNPHLLEEDLSLTSVIFSDTSQVSLELFLKLTQKSEYKPFIVFCQMKDVDKQKITQAAKKEAFIVASGDGANDILMFEASHMAIASSQHDGSFTEGLLEASTISDRQMADLFQTKDSNIYRLFDIDKKQESLFLKKFSRLANSQPKVITALCMKPLKSFAMPRILGYVTSPIPHQFALLLGYDALFLSAIYQATIATASVPLVDKKIYKTSLPYTLLITSVAIASIQAIASYKYDQGHITSISILAINLIFSAASLYMLMAPPGYKRELNSLQ